MSDTRPAGLLDLDNAMYATRSMHQGNAVPAQGSAARMSEEDMLHHFPTRDEGMYKLLEVARTVAPTRVPILISGETGCGKETLAKGIHIAAGRERGRFIVATCSNLPPNFFEMELFTSNRQLGGYPSQEIVSLLLDEVADLEPAMQLKLLRVLKEQESNKVSLHRGSATDARIIACSSKSLQDEAAAGRFRQDLLYKLHVIHLELSPLRVRPVDIEYYADIYLREFNAQFSKNVQLSPTARQALRTYTWPGNNRELRNVVQRAVLLATKDYIGVEELHLVKANSRTEVALSDALPQVTLKELEQRLILQSLRRMNGNRTHTAKALGISLRALRYKLNELVDCGFEVEGKNA